MDNQKIEASFALALNATTQELQKSASLSFGYDFSGDIWETIIRYTGSLEIIRVQYPSVTYYELLGGYCIMYIPRGLIEEIAGLPQIIYMEKPKALFYEDNVGNRASCVTRLQSDYSGQFTGKGVLVAVIDSGIDYSHPDFRNADGRTRIIGLWDQTLDEPYSDPVSLSGGYFDEATINRALQAESIYERSSICPSVDLSGHGTHVAGIAAGNGSASLGVFRGVAYEASLLIVKLGAPSVNAFPSTTQLMRAIDFCLRESRRLQMPLAINISFGNSYGSHSGTSLLETYINQASFQEACCICIGSGNEGNGDGHTGGRMIDSQSQNIEFAVSNYTPSLSIQLWKHYEDSFTITIEGPTFSSYRIPDSAGTYRFLLNQTMLFIHFGEPAPYSIFQEIYIDLLAKDSYIDTGIWKILLAPREIRLGDYELWMPASGVRNLGTRFLNPNASATLTIPSTAQYAISVGAYDSATDQPAAFSGRGNTWGTNQIKPDLVAPGVAVTSCAPGGGYAERTGTSMATPFVTGSCACLMQWGLLEKNDPYLYGEKLKAYLRKGARLLPAFSPAPNPQTGWGALCLRDSIPL